MRYEVSKFHSEIGVRRYYGGYLWECYAISYLIHETSLDSDISIHAYLNGSQITLPEDDWIRLMKEEDIKPEKQEEKDPRLTAKMPESFRPNLQGKTACKGCSKKAIG